jgi:hypothetical protein
MTSHLALSGHLRYGNGQVCGRAPWRSTHVPTVDRMEGDRGDLTDEVLREEIELVGQLVVAATASPGRMRQAEVDSILGVVVEPAKKRRPASTLRRRASAAGRTR